MRQRLGTADGPRSVRRVYGSLTAVLNHALLHDLIARSPCRGVKLPAIEPVERQVLSPGELLALAEALGSEYECMAYLGAVLGLRWGECAGLRVGRIDIERSTITVAEQVTRGAGGRSALGPPKSAAGRRTLAVLGPLMTIVSEQMARRCLTQRDAGSFLHPGPDGEHLDYSNWLHRIWYRPESKQVLSGSSSTTSDGPTPPGSSSKAST